MLFRTLVLAFALCVAAVQAENQPTTYGDALPPDLEPISISAAKPSPEVQALTGRITEVCQKKGCWIVISDGDTLARVMTKHKFFVPTDVSGQATVVGVLEQRTLEPAQRQHLAEDAGKDTNEVPEVELRVVATTIAVAAE